MEAALAITAAFNNGTGKVTASATATDNLTTHTAAGGSCDRPIQRASGSSGTTTSSVNLGNINGVGRPVAQINLTAVSPVISQSFNATTFALGQYSPGVISNRSNITSGATASFFQASPSAAQTAAALVGSPTVQSSFNASTSEDLGLGTLAFKSTADNTASSTYEATATLFIDPAHLQKSSQDLLLGFLGVTSNDAGGFSSLHFRAFAPEGGPTYQDMTFTSITAATTFFTNDLLDLGKISTLHTSFGKIELELSIDAVTTNANDALAFDFIAENSTLLSNALPGDANLDGKVDLTDLNIVLNHLGTTSSLRSDGNFDGGPTIDLTDLNEVLNNLGTSLPTGGAVQAVAAAPEPASLALLALAPLLLTTRRRLIAPR